LDQERNAELKMAFDGVLVKTPHGNMVLMKILDILHFFGPTMDEGDMALQNAAKTILNICGVWGDTDEDQKMIVRKLTGR
jgi:hypothetical protein